MSEYIIDMGRSSYKSQSGLLSADVSQLHEEIVRCRYCAHYEPNGEPSEVYPERFWCDKLTGYFSADFFCAWGIRRES